MPRARGRPYANQSGVHSLILLALLLHPLDAAGQSPVDMLQEFARAASGYTLVGEIETGALQPQRQVTFPAGLVPGFNYMIVGFCDGNCSDMDLTVLDGQGDALEFDDLPDAQPIVLFTPDVADQYGISVAMEDCSVEACSYAVGLFQGARGRAGPEPPGESMEDRLHAFRESLVDEGFSEIGAGESGTLSEDGEINFDFTIHEDTEYRVVAVCDNECGDLNLVLYDGRGEEVEADRLEDAFPLLRLPSAPAGDYQVAVDMVACSAEPCAFRLAFFGRGPHLAPGGTLVEGEILSNSTHRGILEEGDELTGDGLYVDEYTVRLEAGQTVIADLRSSDFDTFLILTGPGDRSQHNDDFSDETTHSHIEWKAMEDGDCTILVTSYSAIAWGEYVLQVAVVEAPDS